MNSSRNLWLLLAIAFVANAIISACGVVPRVMSPDELTLYEKSNFIHLKLNSASFMDTVRTFDPEVKASSVAQALVYEAARVGSYYLPPGLESEETASAEWLKKAQEDRTIQILLNGPKQAKALIVTGDDSRQVLRVEGYNESARSPVFVEEIRVPQSRLTAQKGTTRG